MSRMENQAGSKKWHPLRHLRFFLWKKLKPKFCQIWQAWQIFHLMKTKLFLIKEHGAGQQEIPDRQYSKPRHPQTNRMRVNHWRSRSRSSVQSESCAATGWWWWNHRWPPPPSRASDRPRPNTEWLQLYVPSPRGTQANSQNDFKLSSGRPLLSLPLQGKSTSVTQSGRLVSTV